MNRAKNREGRAALARETLDILKKGFYINRRGERVDLSDEVKYSVESSLLYTPEMWEKLAGGEQRKGEKTGAERSKGRGGVKREKGEEKAEEVSSSLPGGAGSGGRCRTALEVTRESTLQAARRLKEEEGFSRVACLNFASARNPGGGFLKGSGAQEESLARSSALYPCIAQMETYYRANRSFRSPLYTDHLVYSPEIPVFRDDNGELLDIPLRVSFITAPAVNAGEVRKRGNAAEIAQIEPVMRERIRKILWVAAEHGNQALVLGAYGCGVFKNDPRDVANWFAGHLTGEGEFREVFEKVTFAVKDRSPAGKTYRAFQEVF